ncbi:MAG: hypothetical protein IPM64_04880 [Phycisphaerales bacterium]|nr:hypothetical protein [Phycisphaerales bacterium]
MALFALSQPRLIYAMTWLAWEIGPYRELPIVYAAADWPFSWIFFEDAHSALFCFGVLLPLFTLFPAVLLLALFGLLVAAHAWLGWPAYWRVVRPHIELGQVWLHAVRRTWWIWPLGFFIWMAIELLSSAFRHAFTPVVQNSIPFLVSHCSLFAALAALRMSSVLRDAVTATLRPDELLCLRCGYSLRGIGSARCPECGCEREPAGMPTYRLFFRGPGWGKKARVATAIAAVMMLMAPLWIPAMLLWTPHPWRPFVPAWLGPNWYSFGLREPVTTFPIRGNSVCAIRRGSGVVVVAVLRDGKFRLRYEVSHWQDEGGYLNSAPDYSQRGLITGITPVAVSLSQDGLAGLIFYWAGPEFTFLSAQWPDVRISVLPADALQARRVPVEP